MLAFAVVMAAALLYNAMSANVAERTVELSTLQAAGMGPSMLSRLVATENLLLVALGLPVVLAAGTLLASWYMSSYETQGYHWRLDMAATTPFVVAAGVLVAAVLAQVQDEVASDVKCSSVSTSVGHETRAAFVRSNGPNIAARRPMRPSTQDSSVNG